VARECIFCPANAELTLEHISPEWLEEVLTELAGKPIKGVNTFEIRHFDHETGGYRAEVVPSGKYSVVTYRSLCEPCNTYMGSIQGEAKPILVPMIKGVPTTLGEAELRIVTSWSVMTAMTLHARNAAKPEFPRAMRYAFRQSGQIPRDLAVFAACAEKIPILHFWGPADVHWSKEPDLHFNFTTSTFMMGLLVLQVVCVVRPEPRERGMSVQYHQAFERLVWPLPVDFFWPSQFSFTDESSLDEYQSRRFPTMRTS
jgi:hypothetical protein